MVKEANRCRREQPSSHWRFLYWSSQWPLKPINVFWDITSLLLTLLWPQTQRLCIWGEARVHLWKVSGHFLLGTLHNWQDLMMLIVCWMRRCFRWKLKCILSSILVSVLFTREWTLSHSAKVTHCWKKKAFEWTLPTRKRQRCSDLFDEPHEAETEKKEKDFLAAAARLPQLESDKSETEERKNGSELALPLLSSFPL